MDLNARLELSYYKPVAEMDPHRGFSLVQDTRTGNIYVQKQLQVYNADVYRALLANPVPNTPKIFAVFEDAGELTVIEEYVTGDSLEKILSDRGPLPLSDVLRYGMMLCDILTDLHSMNPPVIHRDIKPANCILTSAGRLVLLDFNAARQYDGSKAEDTELLGTFGYAAPEQFGFGESDARTDIYAVGALLKQLLTGNTDRNASVDGPLGEVIRTCMRLAPSDRYQTARALRAALAKERNYIPESTASGAGKTYHRYYPPGFRSGNPLHMVLAIAGYILIFALSAPATTSSGTVITPVDSVCVAIALLGIVALFTDYLGVQEWLRLSPRFRGIVLYLILALLGACLFILMAIVSYALRTWLLAV